MSERVGSHMTGKAGFLDPVLKPTAEVSIRNAPAGRAHEQGWAVLGQLPPPFQVPLKQPGQALSYVANLMRASLSFDAGGARFQVDVVNVQSRQLADSHARGEQHLDHTAVPKVQRIA